MKKPVYVRIVEAGGAILTQRLDFVTAAEIKRGAALEGKLATICSYTRQTPELWLEPLNAGKATIARISLAGGGRRWRLNALIPHGIPVRLPGGSTVCFSPAIPGGTDPYFDPPNLPHGSAEADGDV